MKKQTGQTSLQLNLKQNPDILKTIATAKKRSQLVIGFAAETDNLIVNAKKKLKEKNCDWIMVNNVAGSVFGADHNEITMVTKSKTDKWKKMTKVEIARKLAEMIANSLQVKGKNGRSGKKA